MPLEALVDRVTSEDGYLPDGRAEAVGEQGWAAFLVALRASGWLVTRDEAVPDPWPTTGREAAAADPVTLTVHVSDDVEVNVFPNFGTDGVFFDFDMRQMRRQEHADALLSFIRLLAEATERPVLLSQEGAEDFVFARFVPEQDSLMWVEG